jgi:putative FmdB family regulatory protein
MPIYEYGCQKCGRQHEIVQKVLDKPLTRCPSCKGKLTRLLSASALQFKGSGWYVTDYPKKGSGARRRMARKKDEAKPAGRKEDGSKPAASGE